MIKASRAFTLIEVMVAVMIISVVIMALLTMRGNSTHIFSDLSSRVKINQFASLFISNTDYGFLKKSVTLEKLVSDFDIESDLRRELSNTKVEVIYQELNIIDMSEFDASDQDKESGAEVSSNMVFEIGKTVLKTPKSSTGLLRLRVQ